MDDPRQSDVKNETVNNNQENKNVPSGSTSIRSLSSQPRAMSIFKSVDVSRRDSRSSYLASSTSFAANGGLAAVAAEKLSGVPNATETAQLVERIKRLISLTEFASSMWTQQHDLVVRQFLTESESRRMFAFVDKKTLYLTNQLAPSQIGRISEIQYFVRDNDVDFDPITVDNFRKKVQYGVLQGISLNSLLKLMQKVYLPMFCENGNWPNAVRKDFANQLDRFMATLTDTTHQLQGRTILYLPMDNLENVVQASKSKELVQRLESLLVHWTRQIKEVASNQHSNESAESTGPMEEIAFWKSRCEDLYGLNMQLSQPTVQKITEVLSLAKSTYLDQFMRLSNLIHDGTVQAMDNLRFLSVLSEPCKALSEAELPQIPEMFPKLLHCVRFIWTQSKFYNTKERLTLLLRKISNDVIKRCSSKIKLEEIFEGNVGHAMSVLQDSIACGEALRLQFAYTASHIEKILPSNKHWDFDESSIFAQLDAFMQRCRDLLEIGEAIIQFLRKMPSGQSIPVPIFGGSRGAQIAKEMGDMEIAFKRLVARLWEIRDRILDVKMTQWHDDYNVFKHGVKDMEVMTQNLIQSAFDQPLTVAEQIQLLDFFHSLAHKESVKRMVERRAQDILKHFSSELNFIKDQFEALKRTPEILRWHPDYAGSAAWAQALSRRLAQSWQAFRNCYWFPLQQILINDLQPQVEPVLLALQDYVAKSHGEWSANVPRDIAQRLNKPLMKKITGGPTPLLQLSFDDELSHDFEEVRYWAKLKQDIPFHLQDVAARAEELRVLKEQVLLVVRDYNNIQASLPKQDALIFKERLKFLDKKLSAGLSTLTWASSGTGVADFFVRETRRHCQDVQALVASFSDTHKFVEQTCSQIATEMPLWNIDSKNVYDILEFAQARQEYDELMKKKLGNLMSGIVTRLEVTRRLFENDGAEVARHWQLYVDKMDNLVENALRSALKSSLSEFQKSICGDKKPAASNSGNSSTTNAAGSSALGDANSLFKVNVVLQSLTNKVDFSPSLKEIENVVESSAHNMISVISAVPHLSSKLSGASFYDLLRNEEDVQKVLAAVSQGMAANNARCLECLRPWDGYRELWEINKDAFVRRYAKLKPLLSTFDSDINRYNEVANNIQKEETLRNVGFARLDCAPLKQALVSHCNIWQNKLTTLLTNQADADVARLQALFEEKSKELEHELHSIDDLVAALKLRDELVEGVTDMEAQFSPIHEKYKILEKYEVPLSETQRQQLESLHPAYLQFQQVLTNASARLKTAKSDFHQLFLVELEEWVKSATTLKANFNETYNDLDAETALPTLQQLQDRWQALNMQERQLKKGLTLFNMQAPSHISRDMDALRDEIDWLTSVWQLYGDLHAETANWNDKVFTQVSHSQLDEATSRFTKRAVKLGKDAVSSKQVTVFNNLKEYLARLKKCVPLLHNLQHEGLRDRHWQQLMNFLGKPFDYAGSALTLEKILDLGLETAAEFSEGLADKASKEWVVEKTITEMQQEWVDLRFSFAKNSEGNVDFSNLVSDQVLSTLENHQLIVTTLKTKPEYVAFGKQIDDWEQELSKILEILDQLGLVSSSYACLESVFGGSQDIRKQLPAETVLFESIQVDWNQIVESMWDAENKSLPNCILDFVRQPNILRDLADLKTELDKVQKSLAKFLDTKRMLFPRFYFLSNASLIYLLGVNASNFNPNDLQTHLQSLFGCIKTLKTVSHGGKYHEIKALESIEDDILTLMAPIPIEGPIELWLSDLDRGISQTLRKQLATCLASYGKSKKDKWCSDFAPQILTTALLINWTSEFGHAIGKGALREARVQQHSSVKKWAELLKSGSYDDIKRRKLESIINLQLHARDTIDKLYKLEVSSFSSIDWTSQMRFMWDKDTDTCTISQLNYSFDYGYEYLGAAQRLVWTPATDKCYVSMTLAHNLNRPAIIQGPSGTGKTETVKELGRLFGKFLRIFNCSESFSVDTFRNALSGIAQTGAWACFDEINLLPLSVLSVLASQFSSLFYAASQNAATVLFEDQEIVLNKQMALFSTMNPTAGAAETKRIELPNSLKAMLRPITLAVPDKTLIIENLLYTRGFSSDSPRLIAKKTCFIFQAASQLFSKAEHYDWSLRSLARIFADIAAPKDEINTTDEKATSEEVIACKALQDYILPSLVPGDIPLFTLLLADVFPGVGAENIVVAKAENCSEDYSETQTSDQNGKSLIIKHCLDKKLRPTVSFVEKALQLYQALSKYHTTMLIGPTGSGKTALWQTVEAVGLAGVPVKTKVLNPGVFNVDTFFGCLSSDGDWKDGAFTSLLRAATAPSKNKVVNWIVLDGPIDALWAESLNTLLDETRLLILPNGERLFLNDSVKIIFEIDSLKGASAATISRCPCVYVDENTIDYRAVIDAWSNNLSADMQTRLRPLISKCFDSKAPYYNVPSTKLFTRLFDSLAVPENGVDPATEDAESLEKLVGMWFLFAFIWAFGGSLTPEERRGFDLFMREQEGQFPNKGTVFEYAVDKLNKTWVPWETVAQTATSESIAEPGRVSDGNKFSVSLVPTGQTACLQFLIKHCVAARIPINFIGEAGTGKSFLLDRFLNQMTGEANFPSIKIPLCAEMSTSTLQNLIESKLERRTKDVLVPIQLTDTKVEEAKESYSNAARALQPLLCGVDDLQAPPLASGSSNTAPALEWIKHWIDYNHWYDVLGSMQIKYVYEMIPWAATSLTSSDRISKRLGSRFLNIHLAPIKNSVWEKILGTVLTTKLQDFEESLKAIYPLIAAATVSLYSYCAFHFRQNREAHEVHGFHPRDMIRACLSVAERANKDCHDSKETLLKLWMHEVTRTFADRFAKEDEYATYYKGLNEVLERHFQTPLKQVATVETPNTQHQENQQHRVQRTKVTLTLFSSHSWFKTSNDSAQHLQNLYEAISGVDAVADTIHELIYKTRALDSAIKEGWVLFDEAVETVLKILRVFSGSGSSGRSHLLLMGSGSTGRRSFAKLAAWLLNIPIFEPALHSQYSQSDFQNDIGSLLDFAIQNEEVPQVLFLISSDLLQSSENMLEVHALLAGIPPIWIPSVHHISVLEKALAKIKVVIIWNTESQTRSQDRLRMVPSLKSLAHWIWCPDWNENSQLQIARSFGFEDKGVLKVLIEMHSSVVAMASRVCSESGRIIYVPPFNYIELVNCFKSLLSSKGAELQTLIQKLTSGLDKLEDTRKNVDQISSMLAQSRKQVSLFQKQCEDFLIGIVQQKREGDEQAKMVQLKAEKLISEEEQVKKEADAAQADLEQALPALNAAMKALEAINKKDLGEIKSYGKPPPLVEKVLEAVMILRKCEPTWDEAKRQLSNPSFIRLLVDLDKDNISDKILKKISQYCADESFQPEVVGRVSGAAKSLCMWVRAMETYGILYRQVAPKRESLATAQEILDRKRRSLKDARDKLAVVTQTLAELQVQYDEKIALKEKLARESQEMELRLQRAELLMSDLAGERVRWQERVKELTLLSTSLKGDSLLAAGSLAYLGPLTSEARQKLMKECWLPSLEANSIVFSAFSLADFVGNAQEIGGWILNGLPSDKFSIETALMATRNRRWPLFIDPQNQATSWIKRMETDKRFVILDCRHASYVKTLRQCAKNGEAVLLENVDSDKELLKEPFVLNLLKYPTSLLQSKEKNISPDFSFYMTTRNPNTEFSPTLYSLTTIINFGVREGGLEDQMLSFLLKKEKPELEKQKLDLGIQVSNAKRKLIQLEDDILELLNAAEGSLLDNEKLIQALQVSQQTTEQLTLQLKSSEITEKTIDSTREQYRPAAQRASMLFFLLQNFSSVNRMYQFPLDAYNELFATSIAASKKSDTIKERLSNLIATHTEAVYDVASQALFQRHRSPFAMQLAIKILQGQNKWQPDLYELFLRGGQVVDRDSQLPNPFKDFIAAQIWDNLTELEKFANFQGLLTSIERNEQDFRGWFALNEPEEAGLPGEWDDKVSDFERLVFVRACRPDRITFAAQQFIQSVLGERFLKHVSGTSLASAASKSGKLPVLLLVKEGVDPQELLRQLAAKENAVLLQCALGQNQTQKALQCLELAAKNGSWVFLSNLDLALEAIPAIEEFVTSGQLGFVAPGFKIWLGSRPSNKLPLSLLQMCAKVTIEPPQGIKSHLTRLWSSYANGFASKSVVNFNKWLVALLSFHAIISERQKFASLGWKKCPEFNDDDFQITAQLILRHLDPNKGVSNSTLRFIVEDLGYGGRIEDEYDRKVFHAYVQQYFTNTNTSTISGGGPLSLYANSFVSGSASTTPSVGEIANWIDGMTVIDKPEWFGQHVNADIAGRLLNTQSFLEDLKSLYYVNMAKSDLAASSSESSVAQIAQETLDTIGNLNLDEEGTYNLLKHELNTNPFHTVLLSEIRTYNELLATINQSLNQLMKCISGQADWTPTLETLLHDIAVGSTPSQWLHAYSSHKPLLMFIQDLEARIKFFSEWSRGSEPILFPLGYFSSPLRFLNAVMQRASRKLNTALDTLSWDFTVTQVEDEAHITTAPKDGVYISQLYLQGAGWDKKTNALREPANMELSLKMPPILFRVTENKSKAAKSGYQCPTYYNEERSASSQANSSFILPVELKVGNHDASFWTKRGTALFASLN